MIATLAESPSGERSGTVTACDADVLRWHSPDRHLTIVANDGSLLARASVWWRATPSAGGQPTGLIGHYAAGSARVGAEVLARACALLSSAGCTVAVGPIDGSTWRSYRFVTERGEEPPFLLEPDHPSEWPSHFTDAGFAPWETYVSAVTTDLEAVDAAAMRAGACLKAAGLSIRSLDRSAIDTEMRRVHALALESFRENILYTPIALEEFRHQQLRLLPVIRPELVLLAEQEGALAGFLLAVPDRPTREEGTTGTLVLKTVAVAPHMRDRGLGGVLVAEVQHRAAALGFQRTIHALMHERNPSTRISHHYARVFRRYALFARELPRASGAEPPWSEATPPTDEHVLRLASHSVSLPALRAGETLEGRLKT